MYTSYVVTCMLAAVAHALPSNDEAGPILSSRGSGLASPITVQSTNYLCDVTSSNTNTVRDLGFVGSIGGKTIHTYGDTLAGPGASFYMTSDSSSMGTNDPCKVFDAALEGGNHPAQFVPIVAEYGETNTADAMGVTNVIVTGRHTGMVFFLKNHRPMGGTQYIAGAGVASVTLRRGKPKASRLAKYWWDARKGEPNYGDVTAYSGHQYIWGLGHGQSGKYAYLTRAPKASYTDLSSWEYLDGSTGQWSSNRLYNPSPQQALQWNDEEGSVWGVGQGQMIWSEHYQKIMFVYALSWPGKDGKTAVLARTADRPMGPWSRATTLFSVAPRTAGGLVYAPVPNPYFDESGKTLVVTVTNSPNVIEAHKVVFG